MNKSTLRKIKVHRVGNIIYKLVYIAFGNELGRFETGWVNENMAANLGMI